MALWWLFKILYKGQGDKIKNIYASKKGKEPQKIEFGR